MLPETSRPKKSSKLKAVKKSSANLKKKKKKVRYRSYFRSDLTNRAVWDEPPSGASNIVLFHERRLLIEI
jgi:hypothetical protein